jgi:hypothetical protein
MKFIDDISPKSTRNQGRPLDEWDRNRPPMIYFPESEMMMMMMTSMIFVDLFIAFGTHSLWITPNTTTVTQLIVIDLPLTTRVGGGVYVRYRSQHKNLITVKAKHRSPATRHGGAWGERKYIPYSFLISTLDGGEWSASRPGQALPRRKDPRYPLYRRLGGPQCICLLCLRRGSNPDGPVIHSVVRHCTNWATRLLVRTVLNIIVPRVSYTGLVTNQPAFYVYR